MPRNKIYNELQCNSSRKFIFFDCATFHIEFDIVRIIVRCLESTDDDESFVVVEVVVVLSLLLFLLLFDLLFVDFLDFVDIIVGFCAELFFFIISSSFFAAIISVCIVCRNGTNSSITIRRNASMGIGNILYLLELSLCVAVIASIYPHITLHLATINDADDKSLLVSASLERTTFIGTSSVVVAAVAAVVTAVGSSCPSSIFKCEKLRKSSFNMVISSSLACIRWSFFSWWTRYCQWIDFLGS